MKLVLDASVILKLVLIQDEPHRERASEIVKGFQNSLVEIVLPSFWKYEIGNILSIKEQDNYRYFYNSLLNIGFPTHDFSDIELISVGDFARNSKVSFYDASYHYLAKSTNSTFVTSDIKYFEKVKNLGEIVLLKDLRIPS